MHEHTTPSTPQWSGFKTAANTPIRPPSNDAMRVARQRLKELDKPVQPSSEGPSVVSGFKTAGGRNMPNPSAAALKRAHALWKNDNDDTGVSKQSSKRNRATSSVTTPITPITPGNTFSRPLVKTPVHMVTAPQQPAFQSASTLITPNHTSRTFMRPMFASNLRTPFKSPLKKRTISLSTNTNDQDNADKLKELELKERNSLHLALVPTKRSALFDLSKTEQNRKSMLSYFGRCPRRLTMEQLLNANVPSAVINMTWQQAANYSFNAVIHGQPCLWNAESAYNALLEYGAEKSRLSMDWVEHHYRLIVWKAACIYRSYPEEHGIWSVHWILKQLRYRYEREMNKRETPAIRMILEELELPLLPLVLCVIDMPQHGVLRLTDGWYIINARLDRALEVIVAKQRLNPGDKLVIGSIQLLEQPGEITALSSNPRPLLNLVINNTRRARWDTRLGFIRQPMPIIHISNIDPMGGMISTLDVVVVRKLPKLLMETELDGRKIFTPFRLLGSSMSNEETWLSDHPNLVYLCDPTFTLSVTLDTASEQQASALCSSLLQMDDIIEYCDNQALDTIKNLSAYLQQHPKNQSLLMDKIREQIQSNRFKRRRTGLFRVHVCDARISNYNATQSTMACITIWSPPEQLYEEIKLGQRYKISYVMPSTTTNTTHQQYNSMRYNEMSQLQTNRKSRWTACKLPEDMEDIEERLPTIKGLDLLSSQANYRSDWTDIVFVVLCTSNNNNSGYSGKPNTMAPLVIIGDESNRMALLRLEPNTILLSSFKANYDVKFGMPVIRTLENTELFGQQHTPSFAQSKLQQLLQWKQEQVEDYRDLEDTAVLTMTTVFSTL
ncbi:hypothetical protein BDF19DRAFT_421898 [Syncephalis fuscata]|nr:hypothetical protein BDF19DRAFT_421898 [Syncephalis fuscata]